MPGQQMCQDNVWPSVPCLAQSHVLKLAEKNKKNQKNRAEAGTRAPVWELQWQ